ncbi:MAG: hypothetical protein QM484_04960 [Woeseiaceae bacterium]
MVFLFIVSTPEAERVLLPMVAACQRKGLISSFFFTNDGVKILNNSKVLDVVRSAQNAVVCEHSWERFMGDKKSPIELGSQTQNSMMVGESSHIISL